MAHPALLSYHQFSTCCNSLPCKWKSCLGLILIKFACTSVQCKVSHWIIYFNKYDTVTQLSNSSLLILNWYLSLAKSERPEPANNFKSLAVPVISVLWLSITTKVLLLLFPHKHKEGSWHLIVIINQVLQQAVA